jgi:deoxyadenosine/deoxycytidine kinase
MHIKAGRCNRGGPASSGHVPFAARAAARVKGFGVLARRIEICGGIGAGKSSAARILRSLHRCTLLLEVPEETPFWEEYYLHGRSNLLFEKNVSFVMHHVHLVATRNPSEAVVCDFSFYEDLAYIKLMNDSKEKELLMQLVDIALENHGVPDIVVQLHCGAAEKRRRILARGRAPEANITQEFLQKFDEQLLNILHSRQIRHKLVEVDNFETDLGALRNALSYFVHV